MKQMQLFRGQALWDLLASNKDSPAAKVLHLQSPLVAMPAVCVERPAVPRLTGSLKSQAGTKVKIKCRQASSG